MLLPIVLTLKEEMMIRFLIDDILESRASCLVNTVNCEGFMGKGIAYQFKQKFPENEKYYKEICKKGEMEIGKILLFKEKDKLIANFPTKDKWREKSEYTFIEKGLDDLHEKILSNNIDSVALPPLGCGNGGLLWNEVKLIIQEKLNNLNSEIIVYEPSTSYTNKNITMPKINASHIILMRLKTRLTKFNKMRIQKVCFFVNIFSGENYFKFEEYKFGPYSHGIDIVSNQIKAFQDIYGVSTIEAEKIALSNLISHSVLMTLKNYEMPMLKATNFVNSIKNDHALELISTLVSIVKSNPEISIDEIIERFFWRTKVDIDRFSKSEIADSILNLEKSKIIEKGLIGYSISKEIKTDLLMPQYLNEPMHKYDYDTLFNEDPFKFEKRIIQQ
jgi:O-acetyl-ADP-ribose deacetylase (regulator of RNase III)